VSTQTKTESEPETVSWSGGNRKIVLSQTVLRNLYIATNGKCELLAEYGWKGELPKTPEAPKPKRRIAYRE
jgi:hypothetical protein